MTGSILVPLDGSSFGEHALPWAVAIARRTKAPIRLLHVYVAVPAFYPVAVPPYPEPAIPVDALEWPRAYLEGVAADLRERIGTPVTTELVSGHAVAAFAFLSLHFRWRTSRPRAARLALLAVTVLGALFGWAQLARGAHFASHTLWSAWLCWVVCALAARRPHGPARRLSVSHRGA